MIDGVQTEEAIKLLALVFAAGSIAVLTLIRMLLGSDALISFLCKIRKRAESVPEGKLMLPKDCPSHALIADSLHSMQAKNDQLSESITAISLTLREIDESGRKSAEELAAIRNVMAAMQTQMAAFAGSLRYLTEKQEEHYARIQKGERRDMEVDYEQQRLRSSVDTLVEAVKTIGCCKQEE